MPYTALATLSDGNVLTASHMNTVGSNIEFLNGLASRINTGFNSYRTTTTDLTSANAVWYIRHKHDYLHYKVSCAATPNHVRVFFNGTMYVESTSTTVSGYVDLTDFSTLPGLLGAWATSTSYNFDTNGDSDIVTHNGSYYRCKQDHTGDANSEPGVGASWSTYWVLLAAPTVNTWCNMHVTAGFGSSTQVTVEYLLESPATSI